MSAPDALFDLAVNRASTSVLGTRPSDLPSALARWHATTRFARRVPLADISRCLASRPAGAWHWAGGPQGSWQAGKPKFP